MPQINIRGIEVSDVRLISKQLIDKLCDITGTNRDSFTIEVIESTSIFDGNVVDNYPFIEVCWFDRGLEIQDKVAKAITDTIYKLGISELDLFFTYLEKRNYYYNGKHFA